ncbi:MAG: Hpt domain-containing protein, partial [Pseudomonadota bacterium]
MDEMEEFLNVFFQECDERLGELQEDLAAIQDGNWDMETLNSAFRAVHSVKGGAGAFGLNDLVEFTHIFETLMDVMRAGKLEPDAKVCNVLLRASDMMSALIEAAQGRGAHDRDTANKLMIELAELAGVEPPAGAKSGAASGDAPAEPADAAAAQDAAEEGVGDDEDEDEDDGADDREVVLNFEPGPDFIRSGHDPLKLIRALKQFGRVKAERIGEHLPLEEVEPLEVNFSWKITLDTAVERAELEAFLEMYTLTADISIDDPAADAAEGSEPPAAAEPAADAPAAAGDAPAETAAADGSAETPTADAPAAAATASAADAEAPAAAAPAGDDAARPSTRQQGPASAQTQKVSKALRVELSRIDRLVNMVGEIVITQAVLSQRFAEMELHTDIEFGHAVEALSRQTRELQESVMAIRAQPVKSVFARMPRVVRDLCASLGKECKMVLSGEHVEVDSTVIEELSEPLTHMLRNS